MKDAPAFGKRCLGNGSGNSVAITGVGSSTVNDSDTPGDTANVCVNGTADGITINLGAVTVPANTDAYVVGNGNIINSGSNDTVGVYGTGNVLTISANICRIAVKRRMRRGAGYTNGYTGKSTSEI
ncbi:MAG: hypothetical protein ACXWK3_04345 [Reyranella sp.]